jgi:uncharacterized membrane protein YfcA
MHRGQPPASQARGYTGARVQSQLSNVLIRRLVGILVIAIGDGYVLPGLS